MQSLNKDKSPETPQSQGFLFGDPLGIRTPDPLIKSQSVT